MSKTFCPLPWTHLATHPHGSVTLCCESDHSDRASEAKNYIPLTYTTLHSENYKFKNIINSDYFKQVRIQMLNDEIPPACQKCFNYEKQGLESKRLRESKRLNFNLEKAMLITDNTGIVDNVDFEFVELRLGNHWNLACRTCNPQSSTRLKSEWRVLFPNIQPIDQKLFDWPLDDNFWDLLIDNSNKLRYLYINGGEPLLIDKYKIFLQKLIDLDLAKNIEIQYSTNATVINNDYYEVWKKFKNVNLMLSIDDIEDRNRYIRYPSKWNDITKFLEWLTNLSKENHNTNFQIMQTVSILNIFYLQEFENYFKNFTISYNFVTDPIYYNPSILPRPVKNEILNRLKNLSQITQIENFLKVDNYNKSDMNKFLKITKETDQIRTQNFKDTFEEYYKILGKHNVV